MALNTDANAPTAAASVGEEEEQQQGTSQLPNGEPDHAPISSQPGKTEPDPPPTSEPTPPKEDPTKSEAQPRDHLTVIDENVETSK